MSLGDKESLTKNAEREKVGFNTEKLAEVFGKTKEVFLNITEVDILRTLAKE